MSNRLVYGLSNGVRLGPTRKRLRIQAASAIDQSLGVARIAHPKLLVSGFWRSGTTWLQEALAAALGAKTVFEPLSPMEAQRRRDLLQQFPEDSEDTRQACIPGDCSGDQAFWSYMDACCAGRHSSEFLMSCRRNVRESLRVDIVVKDVRLQANLPYVHDRYRIPIVHIRRHPCGVVASLTAADWHWSFSRNTLGTLLPRLLGQTTFPDLVPDEIVRRYDGDGVSRTAAYWAVTERLAANALDGKAWGCTIPYEQLATSDGIDLAQICRRLNLNPRVEPDLTQPSVSVDPETFASYGHAPHERWQKLLSRTDIAKICNIADRIFPSWVELAR